MTIQGGPGKKDVLSYANVTEDLDPNTEGDQGVTKDVTAAMEVEEVHGSPLADDIELIDITTGLVLGGDGDDTLRASPFGGGTLVGCAGANTLTTKDGSDVTDVYGVLVVAGGKPDTIVGFNADDTIRLAGGVTAHTLEEGENESMQIMVDGEAVAVVQTSSDLTTSTALVSVLNDSGVISYEDPEEPTFDVTKCPSAPAPQMPDDMMPTEDGDG